MHTCCQKVAINAHHGRQGTLEGSKELHKVTNTFTSSNVDLGLLPQFDKEKQQDEAEMTRQIRMQILPLSHSARNLGQMPGHFKLTSLTTVRGLGWPVLL